MEALLLECAAFVSIDKRSLLVGLEVPPVASSISTGKELAPLELSAFRFVNKNGGNEESDFELDLLQSLSRSPLVSKMAFPSTVNDGNNDELDDSEELEDEEDETDLTHK